MNESALLTAISVLLTIVTAYAAFRSAQLASRSEFIEATALRRPRPAASQPAPRSDAAASARRVPWAVVLIAIVAFWYALLMLRPLRFLPVHNPIATARIGSSAAKLEVDLRGTRIEEGDVFFVRLTLLGRTSSNNQCRLSESNVSASLTMLAADVAQTRFLHRYGPSCAADAEWIVAPKHGGRQIVAVTVAPRSANGADITSLEAEVNIDRVLGGEAALSGLVAVLVALIGILTNRKDSIA